MFSAVLSPAKSFNFSPHPSSHQYTIPPFLSKADALAQSLASLPAKELQTLMKISPALSQLNQNRFSSFKPNCTTPIPHQSQQAIFTFSGDTYRTLNPRSFTPRQQQQAQKQLTILSGLYGCLRPLDCIQPHRLEMSTRFQQNAPMSSVWQDIITPWLNERLKTSLALLILASKEYRKALKKENINKPVITIDFLVDKGHQGLKTIGVIAKKARGLFARFIVQENPSSIKALQQFKTEGWRFNASLTTPESLVFVRY